ncbi:unnamed protein product [Amoebophrya sp. A120]|nr:unnamed protein product [Amoebophrya sp. A120]|eukprot:GSA120T00004054001.1
MWTNAVVHFWKGRNSDRAILEKAASLGARFPQHAVFCTHGILATTVIVLWADHVQKKMDLLAKFARRDYTQTNSKGDEDQDSGTEKKPYGEVAVMAQVTGVMPVSVPPVGERGNRNQAGQTLSATTIFDSRTALERYVLDDNHFESSATPEEDRKRIARAIIPRRRSRSHRIARSLMGILSTTSGSAEDTDFYFTRARSRAATNSNHSTQTPALEENGKHEIDQQNDTAAPSWSADKVLSALQDKFLPDFQLRFSCVKFAKPDAIRRVCRANLLHLLSKERDTCFDVISPSRWGLAASDLSAVADLLVEEEETLSVWQQVFNGTSSTSAVEKKDPSSPTATSTSTSTDESEAVRDAKTKEVEDNQDTDTESTTERASASNTMEAATTTFSSEDDPPAFIVNGEVITAANAATDEDMEKEGTLDQELQLFYDVLLLHGRGRDHNAARDSSPPSDESSSNRNADEQHDHEIRTIFERERISSINDRTVYDMMDRLESELFQHSRSFRAVPRAAEGKESPPAPIDAENAASSAFALASEDEASNALRPVTLFQPHKSAIEKETQTPAFDYNQPKLLAPGLLSAANLRGLSVKEIFAHSHFVPPQGLTLEQRQQHTLRVCNVGMHFSLAQEASYMLENHVALDLLQYKAVETVYEIYDPAHCGKGKTSGGDACSSNTKDAVGIAALMGEVSAEDHAQIGEPGYRPTRRFMEVVGELRIEEFFEFAERAAAHWEQYQMEKKEKKFDLLICSSPAILCSVFAHDEQLAIIAYIGEPLLSGITGKREREWWFRKFREMTLQRPRTFVAAYNPYKAHMIRYQTGLYMPIIRAFGKHTGAVWSNPLNEVKSRLRAVVAPASRSVFEQLVARAGSLLGQQHHLPVDNLREKKCEWGPDGEEITPEKEVLQVHILLNKGPFSCVDTASLLNQLTYYTEDTVTSSPDTSVPADSRDEKTTTSTTQRTSISSSTKQDQESPFEDNALGSVLPEVPIKRANEKKTCKWSSSSSAGDGAGRLPDIPSVKLIFSDVRNQRPRLSYEEMARKFFAVVFYPYDVALMMYYELYSMGIPIFVPVREHLRFFLFRGIHSLHKRRHFIDEKTLNGTHLYPPNTSPFFHWGDMTQTEEAAAKFFRNDAEYWSVLFSDYSRDPHLFRFSSSADLFVQLQKLTRSDMASARDGNGSGSPIEAKTRRMRKFTDREFVKAVAKWRDALVTELAL